MVILTKRGQNIQKTIFNGTKLRMRDMRCKQLFSYLSGSNVRATEGK